MKKFYNVNVTLPEDLGSIPFALYTDEIFGKALIASNRFSNMRIPNIDETKPLRASIFYFLADLIIELHKQDSEGDSASYTILDCIQDTLLRMGMSEFDDDDDWAAYWIAEGLRCADEALIKKGLFKAFVFQFEDMVIEVAPKAHTKCSADRVLEFDPRTCYRQLNKHTDKECYSVQLTINNPYGDLIEEFYECPLCIPSYLGEMMLSDYDQDIANYPGEFYYGLVDALKWHAAKLLHNQHQGLKGDPFWGDEDTPLEMFWAMALEQEEIDDDEYEEILDDISNEDNIGRIYEIIDTLDLLTLDDMGRTSTECQCDPITIHYED